MRLLKAQNTNLRNIYGKGVKYDINDQVIIDSTNVVLVPKGTEAQRPTASKGMFRFNDDTDSFEGYDGVEWGAVGGGNTAVVGWENQATINENYTMTTGNNMMSAGPVTVGSGYTVTVPSGSRWVIV